MAANRGAGWKIANSLFLISLFMPLCYPFPFMVMGARINDKKIKRTGTVYFILGILTFLTFCFAMVMTEFDPEMVGPIGAMSMLGGTVIHMIAFAHCFSLLPRYYRELAALEDRDRGVSAIDSLGYGSYTGSAMNSGGINTFQQINNANIARKQFAATVANSMVTGRPVALDKQAYPQFSQQAAPSAPAYYQSTPPKPQQPQSFQTPRRPMDVSLNKPAKKLNINAATDNELAALPGLNIIDAKKAVSYREENGDFTSIEQFIGLLDLKPHIAAPLFDLLVCEPTMQAQPAPVAAPGRRNLDF